MLSNAPSPVRMGVECTRFRNSHADSSGSRHGGREAGDAAAPARPCGGVYVPPDAEKSGGYRAARGEGADMGGQPDDTAEVTLQGDTSSSNFRHSSQY